MSAPLLIGVDVGTSALKALLVSADGRVLQGATRCYALRSMRPGWADQRAQDWRSALVSAVRQLTRGADASHVRAIGLSTQGGTLVPVDAAGEALCPAISWMDTRAAGQQARFEAQVGAERMRQLTGWAMCGGLNALQILWLAQNRPEVFNRTAKFLSTPSYLTQWLTGRAAVDASNGGIEQLMDVRGGRWSKPVLDLLGIVESQLADVVSAHEPVGHLTRAAANELGLPVGTLVCAGGHDQWCAALGAGASNPGERVLATGTAWCALRLLDAPPAKRDGGPAFARHVVPGLWGALLSLERGGASLAWLQGALTLPGSAMPSFDQLGALADTVPPGADGLLFFPHLSGASLRNLSPGSGAAHLARAVMEGVACQGAMMLEALGPNDRRLIVTGGATHSEPWLRMIAGICGQALTVPSRPEVGCLGAAALAGAAAEVFPSPAEGAAALAADCRTIEPGADAHAYRALLARYTQAEQGGAPHGAV